ncbi:uncharacterized protein [Paramisgurnus dabryanus]|uniref:uncharacterized protein n=1 Tax=Paramisgurnus dabryanus TaxID=90735 RepID=UPI0031F4305D
MARKGTGEILKYIVGFTMAFLLTEVCAVETLDFPEASIDLPFGYIDEPLHHIQRRDAELMEFIVIVEVNVSQAVVIELIKSSLASLTFPLQVGNSTEITDVNVTTVCQPNGTEYQCTCEDGYAWSYNNCKAYEACDDIRLGSCGCINGIPTDGEMCLLQNELPITEFLFEIEMNAAVISVISEMRRLLGNLTFPLALDDLVELLDMDITTVCSSGTTGYQCSCEDQYVWPCDKCKEYGSCSTTNDTCSCINAVPSDGQFCQPFSTMTRDTTACTQPVAAQPSAYVIDFDVRFFDSALVNFFRNLVTNINLPLALSNNVNVTDIDMTTVCGLNGTEYECKCEDHHVWSNDTCEVYQVCDGIVGGTCGCIQGLPSEGQLCQRETQPLTEYLIEIEINTLNPAIIDQLRSLLMSFHLPYTLTDNTNITEINITTVCSLNEMGYQCKCEGLFVWPIDTCHSYETCDNITDGVCTCINALPNNGQFCQLKKGPTLNYMIDVDVRFFDSSLVNYLRNLITNINFPLALSNNINVTDIDMTTVCGLNGTEYECKCEEHHVWSNDTCEVYQVCDGIVGGTCGCIQGLPSEGQLCQRDINECKDAQSVCGQNSDCINTIGSHICSCWSGFAPLYKYIPVSVNNSCVLTQPLTEYLIEIEINTLNPAIIDQLRSLLMSFHLPYTLTDNTNITEINITTVCSLNEMGYQCKCEGLFVWPIDTCHSYETCDNITDGVCSCINALPNNGQFCQLKKGPTSNYMIDVDVRFFDSSLVNYLRNLITNINLPLTLSNNINVTDIDMTTVCGLNGTEYECKCEEHHVWSNDTCDVYQVCDGIVGGTCGCIQGLPSEGQHCQRGEKSQLSTNVLNVIYSPI